MAQELRHLSQTPVGGPGRQRTQASGPASVLDNLALPDPSAPHPQPCPEPRALRTVVLQKAVACVCSSEEVQSREAGPSLGNLR